MNNPANTPLHKSELNAVWAIAWPLILTNILNAAVGIADLIMVGVLGKESLAAVGVSRQVTMIVLVLMLAISGGASILVSHAFGAGEKKKVSFLSGQTILFMTFTAVCVVTPVGILFSGMILELMGVEESVRILGDSYLVIFFAGSIFTMLNFAVAGILLGVGETRISFVMLLSVNLFNILFNCIFIYGAGFIPPLGVAGAAAGTIAARGLGTIAGLWILKSKKFIVQMSFKDCLKIDFSILGRIFYLGGPRSLQGIVRNFSRLAIVPILSLLAVSVRTNAIAAYSVGMQVRMVSSYLGLAFMSAAMVRTGQNLGAGNIRLAKKSGWISAAMAAVCMSITAGIFLCFPQDIMYFFTDDINVIKMGGLFFIVIALTEPIMAVSFSLSGSIRGRGDSISPFLIGSASDFGIMLIVGYLGITVFNLGFISIAIAIAITAFTQTIPMTIVFIFGKWKRKIH